LEPASCPSLGDRSIHLSYVSIWSKFHFFSSTTSASMMGPSSLAPGPDSGGGPAFGPEDAWPARVLADSAEAALYISAEAACQASLSFSLADLMTETSDPLR